MTKSIISPLDPQIQEDPNYFKVIHFFWVLGFKYFFFVANCS